MLNFIICDDEEIFRDSIKEKIDSCMMKSTAEYKTYFFSCYYRDRSVGACILCSDRAAGICDGSRASWCLQGNLEYRNPF